MLATDFPYMNLLGRTIVASENIDKNAAMVGLHDDDKKRQTAMRNGREENNNVGDPQIVTAY